MPFLTVMEQAFIDDGALSAEELAAAEAKADAELITEINIKLWSITDQITHEYFDDALKAGLQLPNHQERRYALEKILQEIKTKLILQNM